MAAITLAGHPQPERCVAEFCGSDRKVGDYLLAEVLDRQTPEARDLLLRTSALDRVSGPLADVLTGGSRSERILQSLEDHNAFVTALDAGRSWFRYHHLFAELLERELRATDPALIEPLHRTAAEWYERHGYVVEAIRHAQAGHDWPHAGRTLADHFLDLTLDGRAATTNALLAAFPADVQAADAELAVAFAGASIMSGAVDEGEVYLGHAEKLAAAVPEARRRRFDLRVAGMRVWLGCWRGDLEATSQAMGALQAALAAPTPQELANDNDVYAMAVLNLGTAELWAAQPDAACRDLERALALARRIPRPFLAISCLAYLGLASALNGSRISLQVELAEEAVALGEANGWGQHPVIASGLAVRGIAFVWLGRFEDAERSLDRADHTLRHDREPGLVFVLHYALGLLRFAQGRYDEALAAFRRAEEVQRLLASDHALGVDLKSLIVQTHLALGDADRPAVARPDGHPGRRGRPVPGRGQAAGRHRGRRARARALGLPDSHPGPADPRAPVRRGRPRSARGPARRQGVARPRARARRPPPDDPALRGPPGPRAAQAPLPARRPRGAGGGDPGGARRIRAG
jgi:LuxR family transcriptional regulator, maltose regulon positive regulatory protein